MKLLSDEKDWQPVVKNLNKRQTKKYEPPRENNFEELQKLEPNNYDEEEYRENEESF